MQKKEFYAHGKLLLTGEYAVLDGALSLALPTQYGQRMEVCALEQKKIYFRSLTMEGETWFEEELFTGSTEPVALTLEKILREALSTGVVDFNDLSANDVDYEEVEE